MTHKAAARVTEGLAEPLGVSLTATGANVAVWAPDAAAIELCLFSADGQTEIARHILPGRTGGVRHGHVEGLTEGALYGLRAHGPFEPSRGLRFNPHKLLVDPYAIQLDRPFTLDPLMFGYPPDAPQDGDGFDDRDSAAVMPKAVVSASPPFVTRPPLAVPWRDTVLYELHVRGFTRDHPDIPQAMRGTFAGLAHPAAVAHLKQLGVTTVELMPASAWIDERHLGPLGLTNYWGYNPVTYLVPEPRLAPGGWAEVRAATETLAQAGIETILDVVFNHTGEGDALGPTLSLRGLDNAGYYRLQPENLARYIDDSGTGDTLALDRPQGLRLTMDALRAWRQWGGIEGFRFDLATVLGRRPNGFDPAAPLLAAIEQDPVLRGLKLIAEPWDCGLGGYQLGQFPAGWGEWNDRFRDDVRGFWRGDSVSLGGLARRLAGSEDLLPGRRPSRSVNFVVAHDGFTLADLVSYGTKHNLANGEDNRDGTGDNRSWNNGVEGATEDAAILAARADDQRALLASLILARGTPMLTMGAELGHSQDGNNNAYAQDNALGWLNWAKANTALSAFTGRLTQIRAAHASLRADRFLTGHEVAPGFADVEWRRADGGDLSAHDWDEPGGQTLVMVLSEVDGDGLDRVLVAYHRGRAPAALTLPHPRDSMAWSLAADSADPARAGVIDGEITTLAPRSVVVLTEVAATDRPARSVDPDLLSTLAQAAGVAPEWWTLEGQYHRVSPETQRALLAAMRLPAETSGQARDSLHRLAQDQDRRPLPYMAHGRVGTPVTLRLTVAPGAPTPRTWLSLEADDGSVIRVRAIPQTGTAAALTCRDGRRVEGLNVPLPSLAAGRYQVRRDDFPDIICSLTIAPSTCFSPAMIASRRRRFGMSAQIYSVRRAGDQGVGDFTTLGELGAAAAARGAAVLGINPLHALFNDQRDRASPYYPSDRRFLDPIYLDLAKIPGAGVIAPEAQALSALASIDYPAVWALKAKALEASFVAAAPELDAFISAGGHALAAFATFQAIVETRPGSNWRDWPDALRDPKTAQADPVRVRFYAYLQWLCEQQLAGAAARAGELPLGLCRDLAIGAAPNGAEAWAHAHLAADAISIGAPPDLLGPQGQVWGLPPLDPHRMIADGCRSMVSLFSANMRHAGALRIDHVMGLSRLFWVPEGAEGSDGAYVANPLDQLLAELALESERAECMVIGEDLGTVPPGLREVLAADEILSYRVLPFERDGTRYRRPDAYPTLAFACAATHDLPPLAGWWEGLDIEERQALALFSPDEADRARRQLRLDKQALIEALVEVDLIAPDAEPDGRLTAALSAAIHGFMAMTPSVLAVAQVEDLAGERTAVNLPGTDRERANWRRRIGLPLEQLMDGALAQTILAVIKAERPG